jgi:hypothetical protein
MIRSPQGRRHSAFRHRSGDGRAHDGYVAHYDFGVSRLDIRTLALIGADTMAPIVALLWVMEYFGRLPKSK